MRQTYFLLGALSTLKIHIKQRQVDNRCTKFKPFCSSRGTNPGIQLWRTDKEVLGLSPAKAFCWGKLIANPKTLLLSIMAVYYFNHKAEVS